MQMGRTLVGAVAIVAGMVMTMPVMAQTYTYQLDNVLFSDDARLTGTFDYSPSQNQVFSFELASGGGLIPEYSYSSTNPSVSSASIDGQQFSFSSDTRELSFTLRQPLSAKGGYDIISGNEYETVLNQRRDILGGSVEVAQSAAPEPGTWALMILGFGIAGYAPRTRKRSISFGNQVARTI